MHISKIMLAVAALSVGATAFAAPAAGRIAISSGASATKGNLRTALTTLCTSGGGTLTEFTSGGNISTYVCNTTAALTPAQYAAAADSSFRNFAGTAFAELRLNVTGGSFTAVCLLNGFPAGTACANVNAGGAADKYRDPASTAGSAGGADTVLPQAGQVIVGGLLDVAPGTWPTGVLSGLTIPAASGTGVGQSFGVAVSNALYGKLFAAQKSTGAATLSKPIPSSCLETDYTKLECIPTVSKGQMATIMSNNEFDAAHAKGVGFLTGDPADETLVLEYNRRADTSGTQASAQAYFLGLPCSSNPLTIADVSSVPAGTNNNIDIGLVKVFAHAGTGDVRNRLNDVTTTRYGIGIMSGENNQSDAATTWKWVRVQGSALGESAKPGTLAQLGVTVTNRASVVNGGYDFYFESAVAPGSAAGASTFWSAVTGTLNTLAAPVGLLNASDLGGFNKGGNACQANATN